LCRGLAASAGAVVGRLAFTAEQVKEFQTAEQPCILVREETSADDYIIMEVCGVYLHVMNCGVC